MGRRSLFSLLILLILSVLFVQSTRARLELSVDESATVITLKELAPELALATVNGTGKPIDATVRIEFVTTSDTVDSTFSENVTISPGRQKLLFTLPLRTRDFSPNENSKILWYRLRYSITPLQTNQAEAVGGIVSISQITPELYELNVAHPEYVRKGMVCRALVTTLHPITRKPIQGVEIKGLLKIDDEDNARARRLTASTVTNNQGFAYVDFNLPRDIDNSDLELVVDATRGLLTADAASSIQLIDPLFFIASTDKPLYQPGQTVFSRALIIDSARRVVSGIPVSFKIKDEDDETVFNEELETSRFGIAKTEWAIPDSAKLGDYELTFEIDNGNSYSQKVRVSRYELPTFAVNVDLDHDYYLAGQNATATVKADYLFGKPVTRGHVKVVRETKRTWNYREQRYDIEEADQYEGEAGADGFFKAQISLSDDHDDLKDEEHRYYQNITYTAYFTDASTNRTEQKHFDIRITKQPIHIYVIRLDDGYAGRQGLPLRFYLSTFYANGSPASCNVEVFSSDENADDKRQVSVGKIKTDKNGLAKIDNWRLPDLKDPDSSWRLSFVATDKAGKVGRTEETVSSEDETQVRITTEKSIFAPGEPIEAHIKLTEPNSLITIGVASESTLLHSQLVRASSREFSLVIPYKPEFKGELTLAASVVEGSERKASGVRTVLFPRNRDLQLKVDAGAQTYLPGEQGSVRFQTINAAGRPVESALGVVIVDPAVQERFSTDVESDWGYSLFNRDARSFVGLTEGIGSITRRSLDLLDPTKPIAPDISLIAEILLNNRGGYSPSLFASKYDERLSWIFSTVLETKLKPMRSGLENIYDKAGLYPTSESSLRQLLTGIGIDFDKILDPWGNRFRPRFSNEGPNDVLELISAGPDKRFDTADDFSAGTLYWQYFKTTGLKLRRAFDEYHKRTGGYINDYASLREEFLRSNINLDTLLDRWGNRYKFNFEVNQKYYALSITSISPTPLKYYSRYGRNEFAVWEFSTNYFAEHESKIDLALARYSIGAKEPPTNMSELDSVLKAAGIDLSTIRDPWGVSYYQTFAITSFYTDKTTVTTVPDPIGPPIKRVEIKPVTRRMALIHFRSAGPDKTNGTSDDFTVATFYSIASDRSASDVEVVKPQVLTTSTGYTSVILGTVVDPNGAFVVGAKIKATKNGGASFVETQTESDGRFALRNLEPGVYELLVSANGFKPMVVTSIVVHTSTSVQIDVVLKLGEPTETVTIQGDTDYVSVTSATVGETVTKRKVAYNADAVRAKQQLSTPRVRGYFPETLLWQPELTTDKKGRAQLDFKLADNITTWKMSVIGSTENGELGIAETDIRAFQPFFAELDPPRVLTEGDRISLPVVLRNYLDKKQRVELELKPESWFSVTSASRQTVDVPAGDSQSPTFDLKAIASIKDGKQRATARGTEYSDAIEKPVTVHPDGEEVANSQGDLLSSNATVQINLPPNVIAGSARMELKVYPNLMGHVWESVEGIMQRPYGCAEQTISATYPSLLVLRHLNKEDQQTPFARKARGYLEMGYQRLLTYQRSDGSFGYWNDGESDVALTAYAVRFLQDAKSVMAVNGDVLTRATNWLIKEQRADGRWRSLNWKGEEITIGSPMVTAVVARALALQLRGQKLSDPATLALQKSLKLSFSYLDRRSKEIDEPYLIASYALAASLAGDSAKAEGCAVRLQDLAHSERTGSYWSLEMNSPYYGWGLTGRVETTALVVNALASIKAAKESDDQKRRTLQARGLLFLLKNKDRYGCWYSTQATINVLDAMLSLLGHRSSTSTASEVQVLVNGVPRGSLTLPNSNKQSAPLLLDLSPFVQQGSNQIELRRPEGGPMASLQAVTTYYVPWRSVINSEQAERQVNNERLILQTVFDKTNSKVMEEITCRVKAERVGFSGYGMLLAEIGLPPGADVDRGSLEAAKVGSGWAIGRYDVLPDRVVVYLWAQAGGTEFSFKFKPRLAMTAKSTASTIYDYYNPESNAVVAPTTFTVR